MGLMNIRLPPLSINCGGRFIESTSKMAVGRNGMHREWRKRGKGAFGLYDKQTSSSPSSRLMTKTAHFLSLRAPRKSSRIIPIAFSFWISAEGHSASLRARSPYEPEAVSHALACQAVVAQRGGWRRLCIPETARRA